MELEWDHGIQKVAEGFLAVVIVGISTAFLLAEMMGNAPARVSLAVVFYSVLPLSMVLISYLSFRVGRMVFASEGDYYEKLSPVLMAMLLGVVAVNIGFISTVANQNVLAQIGTIRMVNLVVILSMALSFSVLLRKYEEF